MDAFSVTIDQRASKKLFDFFSRPDEKFGKALDAALFNLVQFARGKAVQYAPYKSGTLRRSITTRVTARKQGIIGINLVYARQREFGGTIVPRNAKALVFKVNGHWVRTQRVVQKGKPYFKPAYDETLKAASEIIQKELDRIIKT